VRILLGLSILVALFALAWAWQTRTMASLRDQRAPQSPEADAEEVGRAALEDLPEGWGAVIVGRPSGATPLETAAPPQPPEPVVDESRWRELEERALVDYQVEVQPGQSLSRIAREHYGRLDAELIERLARHNGLADPDHLEVGAILLLPSEERLFE